MSDHEQAHLMADLAALHALGALSQHEARAFEAHLAGGCVDCRVQHDSYVQIVAALGYSAFEEQPAHSVREALLAEVRTPTLEQDRESMLDQFQSIRGAEGDWTEVQEGVLVKTLYVDQMTGIATSLIRMLPGTSLPPHRHTGVEQILVLEGDCYVAGEKLTSGDYHRAAAGSAHETTYTEDGTLFLLLAPEHYQALEAR